MFELVCLLCQVPHPSPAFALALGPEVRAVLLAALADDVPAFERGVLAVPQTVDATSLGLQLELPQSREISFYLTPSPARCAPLVELAF